MEIINVVKEGKIKCFFVIVGCDVLGKGGEYYCELVMLFLLEIVILIIFCGKFCFNDVDYGVVFGIEILCYIDLG